LLVINKTYKPTATTCRQAENKMNNNAATKPNNYAILHNGPAGRRRQSKSNKTASIIARNENEYIRGSPEYFEPFDICVTSREMLFEYRKCFFTLVLREPPCVPNGTGTKSKVWKKTTVKAITQFVFCEVLLRYCNIRNSAIDFYITSHFFSIAFETDVVPAKSICDIIQKTNYDFLIIYEQSIKIVKFFKIVVLYDIKYYIYVYSHETNYPDNYFYLKSP